MMQILKLIIDFFRAETNVYSHRNRTIEEIASEKGINIDSIKAETKASLQHEGRVEAISKLRKQFHVPTATAWVFVDNLDIESPDSPTTR